MESVLKTTIVTQIGILCNDIEATAKAYGDFFGMEYTIMQTGPQEEAGTVYLGQPTAARCKQAFFQMGDVQLELIEPDMEPSVWRYDLETRGEGLHHLAFYVKDTDGMLAKLAEMGMETLQTGGWDGGRYAYVDARGSLKVLLETLEDLR